MAAGGDARARLELVARRSYGKLVAFLAARTRDVGLAEDALADAFASALEAWPRTGMPDNPEGWLMTVARRRIVDLGRRRQTGVAAQHRLELAAEELADAAGKAEIPDHRLALMFAAAHPALDESVRAPLILQAVLGLSAETIASAFLTSPAAMGKRLVRAKEKLRLAGIPFAVPEPEELPHRLGAVLDAIYAAFTEGWSDALGSDAGRRDLTGEALFLAEVVVGLLPDAPEALGLHALMLYADSRRAARRDPGGEYVPFAKQDMSLWDEGMLARAEALLHRAVAFGIIGRYQLEAALQSAHVARRRTGTANWPAVLQLYDALLMLAPSPVLAVNRALVLAEIDGPKAGLTALDAVAGDPQLAQYQPYWATRAELLSRAGANASAREAYQVAIGLERDPAIRGFLASRQALLAG